MEHVDALDVSKPVAAVNDLAKHPERYLERSRILQSVHHPEHCAGFLGGARPPADL